MAAIYQWYEDLGVIFTTTIYPIESQDAITFSVSFQGGYLNVPEEDFWQWSQSMVTGDLLQVYLPIPEQSDEWKWVESITTADLIQAYLPLPEQTDEWNWVESMVSGDLLLALVKVDTQTDGMTFAVSFAGGTLA